MSRCVQNLTRAPAYGCARSDARAPLGHQEHYNFRLREPSEFESAESLQEECKEFLEKITQFNALVQSITQVFEAHANQIQTEKLTTIGLRNIIDMQREHQRRKEQQLQSKRRVLECGVRRRGAQKRRVGPLT